MSNEEQIRLREAAEQLGVHYMTAYRYVRTGTLPAEQRNGQWFVDAAALAQFVAERGDAPRRPGRPPAAAIDHKLESLAPRQVVALAGRLLHGDQGGAWRLVDSALGAGVGIRQLNAQLLTPALRRIGNQWATGEVSIGDEHRATVVAQRLIARLGQHFNRPGRKLGTIVISAAPGDRHSLPTAIVADLLRAEGFDVVDLGADTPSADIAGVAARQDRLVAVGICATSPLNRTNASNFVEAVAAIRSATDAPVLIGGLAITDAITKRSSPDCRSVDADDAVNWFVDLARRPPGSGVTQTT